MTLRTREQKVRGGNAAGLVYPLAACALAEHYVFRRIGGSSSGAAAAAATAAAELGRSAPDRAARPQDRPQRPDSARPTQHSQTDAAILEEDAPRVAPGFGGLAELVGWLAHVERGVPPGDPDLRILPAE